jgi:SAM-dependent methyltransferase
MLSRFVRANRNAAAWLERRFPASFAEPSYKVELERRIQADMTKPSVAVVLEVGGIDRPLLSRSKKYQYVGLDIEVRPDCHTVYDRFIVQTIEAPVEIEADMVVSITLLEHVPDNTAAVRCMHDALRPGGTTHHYIPRDGIPTPWRCAWSGPRCKSD